MSEPKMRCLGVVVGVVLALLCDSPAAGQMTDSHMIAVAPGSWTAAAIAPERISTTDHGHVLVELAPDEVTPRNLYDLQHRTIVFTPDGYGSYSRSLGPLDSDALSSTYTVPDRADVQVQDGAVVELESFWFDFAGQRRHSFYVSDDGALSFDEPITKPERGETMQEIVASVFDMPAIAPRYRPGDFPIDLRVRQSPESVTITWHSSGRNGWLYFGAELFPDHSIAFHYVAVGEERIGFSGLVLDTATEDRESIFTCADLSEPDAAFSDCQAEVFHPGDLIPDTLTIACDVVDALGDTFDALTFYSEELIYDAPMRPASIYASGRSGTFCNSGRLRGAWAFVNPMYYLSYGDRVNTYMFSHELSHIWGAGASYLNAAGEKVQLNDSGSHWPRTLHTPAAFVPDSFSVLGGSYWMEGTDGQFYSVGGGSGHSWLDLYKMGLASAEEVPDVLIVQNGEKEIVTIDQIDAADGPIEPTAATTFNVGFVYLARPGERPDDALLRKLAAYRDANFEFWNESTDGRLTLTSAIP